MKDDRVNEEVKLKDLEQLLANEVEAHKQMERELNNIKKARYNSCQETVVAKEKVLNLSALIQARYTPCFHTHNL